MATQKYKYPKGSKDIELAIKEYERRKKEGKNALKMPDEVLLKLDDSDVQV